MPLYMNRLYVPVQQNGGIGVSLIHGKDKLRTHFNAVLIGLPLVLRS